MGEIGDIHPDLQHPELPGDCPHVLQLAPLERGLARLNLAEVHPVQLVVAAAIGPDEQVRRPRDVGVEPVPSKELGKRDDSQTKERPDSVVQSANRRPLWSQTVRCLIQLCLQRLIR